MFNRIRNKAKALLAAIVGACALPTVALAQLDVSAATTAISDGQTGVVTVLTALMVAFGAFLGIRMVLRVIKRGG